MEMLLAETRIAVDVLARVGGPESGRAVDDARRAIEGIWNLLDDLASQCDVAVRRSPARE
jgi:hypothetical protein